MQVEYAIDLDFASGLRAALRQDPDVIMVGEIRDTETAKISIRASMTGHLVFSTLHTNSAVGAVATLYHMGIQPYLIASATSGVVAQRLIRKICPECREKIRVTKGLKRDFNLPPDDRCRMYRGRGCAACLNTGYAGRTGVFELLIINQQIRHLIMDQAGDSKIEEEARQNGFQSLRENAFERVCDGTTSPEEAMRAVFLSG